MATGSRELDLLSPTHLVERVDALLLTGGSAFGLAAADGVMAWLAELGEGFVTGAGPVPLVPGAVIFDLAPGILRPDSELGRKACSSASSDPVREGSVGAGAGATIGKALGPAGASVGGVGSASEAWGEFSVGSLAVVNAMGDVVSETGTVLSGTRDADGDFPGTDELLGAGEGSAGFAEAVRQLRAGENTTLLVVGTDAPLSRQDLARLARMASTALPRAIVPVNTPLDGDITFALSTADATSYFSPAELSSLGVRARWLAEEAIRRGASFGEA
jgi:L-aminopeptidase/D-esterase-like protein